MGTGNLNLEQAQEQAILVRSGQALMKLHLLLRANICKYAVTQSQINYTVVRCEDTF